MMSTWACGMISLLLSGAPAAAAELFYMDHDAFTEKYVGPVGPLVFSGEIEPGDYDLLLTKILSDESRFLAENKILLASDGGDIAEAMKIARLVKSMDSEVIVGRQTGRCVSACFLIYAAAQQRATEGDGLIGINRPYFVDPGVAATAAAATDSTRDDSPAMKQVRVFLQENDVPASLIAEMFRHASNDAYWLSIEDENKLGSKSRALTRMLSAKCGWDEGIERDAYAGRRPINDLVRMWKCRAGETRALAHGALLAAAQDKAAREKSADGKVTAPTGARPRPGSPHR